VAATLARRLQALPSIEAHGRRLAVAIGVRARLLGLAGLDRDEVGCGLLIPRCRSVHTCGMRFALDVVFLDADGRPLALRRGVPRRRIVSHRGAAAVLELPASSGSLPGFAAKSGCEGGEFLSRAP
jgi:uncharacterized protein